MSAYLRRVGSAGRAFEGRAVDITSQYISKGTARLLTALNVTFVPRPKMAATLATWKAARSTSTPSETTHGQQPPFDMCFIDAAHDYHSVTADFHEFAPWCAAAMFHDVHDISCMGLGNYSGGTPLFWHHLSQRVKPRRITEFASQLATQPGAPVFGIGLVASGGRGTAEADAKSAAWPEWSSAGAAEIPKIHAELCASSVAATPLSRRFCGLYGTPEQLGEQINFMRYRPWG